METAKFLTELSVIDYYFSPLKSSSVGLAALMTAMEGVDSSLLSDADKQAFAENVYYVAKVSPNDAEVMGCRKRLRTMYYDGDVYEQLQLQLDAAAAATGVTMIQVDASDQVPALIQADVPDQVPAEAPAQAAVRAQEQVQLQNGSVQQLSGGVTAEGAEEGRHADGKGVSSDSPKGVDMTGTIDGSYMTDQNEASENLNKELESAAIPAKESSSTEPQPPSADKKRKRRAEHPVSN